MKICMVLIVLSALGMAFGENILILLPLPFFSHTNTFMPLFKELAARGHNITMVSAFPQKETRNNWTDIVIDKEPILKFIGKAVSNLRSVNMYEFYIPFWRVCSGIMEAVFQDRTLQDLIKNDDLNFDLLITGPYFIVEPLTAFSHKLNVPMIGINPLPLSVWPSYYTGNPMFSPDKPNCRTHFSNEMSFFERMSNFFVDFLEISSGFLYYLPLQEKLMEKYMVYRGSENRPPLHELLHNVSLLLVDYHYSIGYPHPLQPNTIEVGGVSLHESQQLPEDLQAYMDNSPNGVIYLNFGTLVSVSTLEEDFLEKLVSTFRRLNVNILMKWENNTFENKPANVEVRKWFPQLSVLAHPKCRLFITHGGIHGIAESAYHGVPVVGIAFFSDQRYNLKFTVTAGFGYSIPKDEITEDKLYTVITTVLNDKSYKNNAVRRSKIVRERPHSALETAVYWVEYVIRHKDVSHLKPAIQKLSLYQQFLFDVYFVFFLVILFVCILIYFFFKMLLRTLFNLLTEKEKKTKND